MPGPLILGPIEGLEEPLEATGVPLLDTYAKGALWTQTFCEMMEEYSSTPAKSEQGQSKAKHHRQRRDNEGQDGPSPRQPRDIQMDGYAEKTIHVHSSNSGVSIHSSTGSAAASVAPFEPDDDTTEAMEANSRRYRRTADALRRSGGGRPQPLHVEADGAAHSRRACAKVRRQDALERSAARWRQLPGYRPSLRLQYATADEEDTRSTAAASLEGDRRIFRRGSFSSTEVGVPPGMFNSSTSLT